MAYGIGIDTGGTYTDAVIYDFDTRTVLAAGKSPTTRQDLSLGIGQALDTLPAELLRRAEVVAPPWAAKVWTERYRPAAQGDEGRPTKVG